jgi:hypothetical protein
MKARHIALGLPKTQAKRRRADARSGDLFSYVNLEKRVPAKHPLRLVRDAVDDILAALDSDFAKAGAHGRRPSIAPELCAIQVADRWHLTTGRSAALCSNCPVLLRARGVARIGARIR